MGIHIIIFKYSITRLKMDADSHLISNNIIDFPNLSHFSFFNDEALNSFFEGIPRYWYSTLYSFAEEKPFLYYKESTYNLTCNLLTKLLKENEILFLQYIKTLREDIDQAFFDFTEITHSLIEIESDSVKEKDIRGSWLPLYLKLIEGPWVSLAKVYLCCIEKPTGSKIGKIKKQALAGLHTKLYKQHKMYDLFIGWNKTIRDNIAHQLYRASLKVFEKDEIIFENSDKTTETYSFRRLQTYIRDLYDCCSAMMYPLLVALGRLDGKYPANSLGIHIRERLFKNQINDVNVRVTDTSYTEIEGGVQRNIEIDNARSIDITLFMHSLYVLKVCHSLLPATQYFLSVHKGKKLLFWISIKKKRLLDILNDKLSLQDLLATGDIQTFFINSKNLFEKKYKKRKWFRSWFWKFLWTNLQVQIKKLPSHIGYKVIREQKKYVGTDLRSHVYILLKKVPNRRDFERIIKAQVYKRANPLKNLALAFWDVITHVFKRKGRARSYHSIVLVSFWLKEKREADMNFAVNNGHPLCLACAEWNKDEHFKWLSQKRESDIQLGDITLRFFVDTEEDSSN
jgi:hypothetical protein